MQYKVFLLTMALGLVFTNSSFAQGPVGDEVMVTFDQTVQVGSHSLPAGKYTIRQVTSASNPRVLEFTSKNGTRLDATVTAIPVLQNNPPSKTRVILDEEGGVPRVDKIWVQGKSYGYQFPGKANAPAIATNRVGLEGTYVAQAAPVAAPVAQQRAPEPPPAPAAQSTVQSTERREESTTVAQNRAPETPAPAPAPQQPVQTAQAPPPSNTQNAAPETPAPNSTQDQNQTAAANTNREVPATALGWMQIALLGMVLTGAGAFLYRWERADRR